LLKPAAERGDGDDDDEEDAIREAMFLLLRLYYAKAYHQKQSLQEEFELLKNSSLYDRDPAEKEPDVDTTWRLDSLAPSGSRNTGPLLDSSGRVRFLFDASRSLS
jgi:hypothetical protein